MTELNDTLSVARTAPNPRRYAVPFWEGTRQKKIMLQFDPANGRYQFVPRPTGLASGRRGLQWREASGKGEVFTYTVARRARDPFRGHEPFLIAMVTLAEGVNVMANVVHCRFEDMKIGLKMKPYWAPLPDGTNLLMF